MEIDDIVVEGKVKAALEGLPLLTIDLVKQQAKNSLVIVTCANWQYYDFVLNWVGHVRKLGVTNFLVGILPFPPSGHLINASATPQRRQIADGCHLYVLPSVLLFGLRFEINDQDLSYYVKLPTREKVAMLLLDKSIASFQLLLQRARVVLTSTLTLT